MKKFIILAVLVQFFILFSLLLFAYIPIYFGESIKVSLRGYDPRDLLLGNYVSFEIDGISTVDTKKKYKQGEEIFLTLENNGSFHVGKKLLTKRPKNRAYLKGRVRYSYKKGCSYKTRLKFGIEKYYSSEKKSRDIEKKLRKKSAVGTIGVLYGLGRIKRVEI